MVGFLYFTFFPLYMTGLDNICNIKYYNKKENKDKQKNVNLCFFLCDLFLYSYFLAHPNCPVGKIIYIIIVKLAQLQDF
jgi:hypothetical protein